MKILYTLFFLGLTGCILTHSQISLYYALTGLQLWFDKMIPALLPFMILSGIMIRMRLTEGFCIVLYPAVRPVYHVRKNVCYAMIMGFLCGFPMGARVAADLLSQKMITRKEAEFLLTFCNNIGPVYFCSFVLPLLQRRLVWPYLFGMYGIPLLYGFVQRYTAYRDIGEAPECPNALSGPDCPEAVSAVPVYHRENVLEAVDASVSSAIQSILSLGGYMILFNLLNLIPHIAAGRPFVVTAPLLEITGGLSMLGSGLPLYSLLLLSFGGASCIAQTYSCIKGTGLSIGAYTFHKLLLTACTAVFYLLWFVLSPETFLL